MDIRNDYALPYSTFIKKHGTMNYYIFDIPKALLPKFEIVPNYLE